MSTPAPTQRSYPAIDAAEWLFHKADKSTRAVRRALDGKEPTQGSTAEPGALRRIVRATLAQEITAALKTALHVDVAGALLTGWHKYQTLVDAARETAAHPGTTKVLALADHHLTASQPGAVDVILDGRRLLTISGQLDLDFHITGALAVLRDGRLMAIRAGQVKIVGTATVQDQQISRRTTTLPLDRTLNLGPGITLAARRTQTTGPTPQPGSHTARPAATPTPQNRPDA